jgi:N-acetylmuramoyl-L-alanine amidase
MSGTLRGTDSWFRNPASQVSAHFGIGMGGEVHQYVDLGNVAWSNGVLEVGNRWAALLRIGGTSNLVGINPNALTISIETEDFGSPRAAVSLAQLRAVLAVSQAILMRFPSINVLTGHDVISPGSRAHCPGDRWRSDGHMTRLAFDLGLSGF